MREGFTPTITPDLARNEILQGIGFIPRGPETQIYSIADSDLSLVATAEITLGGMLADKVLEEEELPLKYCGISHCYRTEAGADGRATRGLYRVHQFTKIEMFAFTLPEQERRDARLSLRTGMPASSTAWACPTASSTPPPATLAARPIANTISKPGCPAAANPANSAK